MCIMDQQNIQDKEALFNSSKILELAAADDISAFKSEVQQHNINLNQPSFWYTSKNAAKHQLGLQQRTPLMIAATYASLQILKFTLNSINNMNINQPSASDGATALHCAAAGGATASLDAVKLLLDASADPNLLDNNGRKPVDVIARGTTPAVRKGLRMLLLNEFSIENDEKEIVTPKKGYPVDVSLPDINDGVYGSDEFRMYTFKVQPCSRAYSHDWTECPFVHPGENARRRDLRKFNYSCVLCPEFRKGSCGKGDVCEYAHGVFESWLHPAQYKTRLCKDENTCTRKVCFFAHKMEDLRPVFPATGSADTGSPPGSGNLWSHLTPPPALQLPGSRLKTALNARDLEIEPLIDDMSSDLYTRFGVLKGTKIDDVFGSHFSPRLSSSMTTTPTHLQSPSRHLHSSPVRASYPLSNPVRKPSFGFDYSAAVAQAMMNSRSGSFGKQRSQSFIDRGKPQSINLSEWGSPDGKLEWGFNGEEASKLRKSASFGFKNGNIGAPMGLGHEPDGSWVGTGLYSWSEKLSYGGGGGGDDGELPQWVEQMYIEREQLVA